MVNNQIGGGGGVSGGGGGGHLNVVLFSCGPRGPASTCDWPTEQPIETIGSTALI